MNFQELLKDKKVLYTAIGVIVAVVLAIIISVGISSGNSKGANGSIVTVNANDNIGIKSYYYGGKHYASNTLKFSGHFASGKSVSVVVYDKASNSVTVTCTAP